jgi:hypothetical protein
MEAIPRQVLIGYHEADSELVYRLDEDLIKRGIKVWLDIRDIKSGQSRRKATYEGIVNSDCFLACLSPQFLEDDFCRTQLFLARAYNKQILPVLISDFPPEQNAIPKLIEAGQQYMHALKGIEDLYILDFSGSYGRDQGSYEKNFAQLVNAIQPVPKPSPLNAELFYFSYSVHDTDFANLLARDIELARGVVWFFNLSTQAGENWREAMYRGLRTAHRFVICLSPEAVHSEHVKHELLIARMRNLPIYPVISERIYDDQKLMKDLRIELERSVDLNFLSDLKWYAPDPDYQSLLTSLKKSTGLIEPEHLRRQGIFISYRRADSQATAGRIHEKLVERFGAETVFMDVDNIPPGEDFAEYYNNWLKDKAAIVLIIIGKTWVTMKTKDNESGLPRLHQEDDHVRIEVATALGMNQLKVIPVLIDDADMPQKADLPESLHRLPQLNASKVRQDPDFRSDIKRLITVIENIQQR